MLALASTFRASAIILPRAHRVISVWASRARTALNLYWVMLGSDAFTQQLLYSVCQL